MNIPSNIITLIIGIVLTLVSLWYGQNHGLLPVAASQEAEQVDGIFNFMMTIATGLFLLIEGVLLYCVFKFRRRKGDKTDGPPIEGNVPLEVLWTAIPTAIVLVLAIYSFEVYNNMGGLNPMASHDMGSHQMTHQTAVPPSSSEQVALASDANGQRIALGLGASPNEQAKEPPLTVNVNGIQYAWIFTYPSAGIVSGELHVPVGQPIQLNISAGDVIHAFWVPQLRIKQDAIPGRDAQLTFTATRTGKYPVICAELCGAYHGGMKTYLYVQTPEEYNQWVQDNTLAQKEDFNKAVAVNSANVSNGEFLAPYTQEMGIEAETLDQLHALHHSMVSTNHN
ncbi:heme/copper-type cytochrome/quinol oxidases, subunit 2 [Pleurocapsa sp. PCC 7327]|uniref:cytochrome c oxidase subunit II n=1 Tax=Pleurocapsa sp. PCC 7327 TaxID=118163 RepID=UPI00029FC421|nr:cytochrome c oxidase subunit II [Pleurocapsa sp. PCC 7327]AFY76966.1 heme/copper-type cytochrome/quinol oxidases, subunit 2 [Pleurocapsa sp. PCC 7327]